MFFKEGQTFLPWIYCCFCSTGIDYLHSMFQANPIHRLWTFIILHIYKYKKWCISWSKDIVFYGFFMPHIMWKRPKTMTNVIFPWIGAHTLISTLLWKKSAHPQGYKVKQSSRKEEPSPPPYTWKTCFYCHFIYNSFKSFNYSKVSTGVPLNLVPSF